MSGCDEYAAVTSAERTLTALKLRVEKVGAEERRNADTLKRLQTRLKELRRECGSVRQRTCEVSADTATILDKLRADDELEVLNKMLLEKNAHIFIQQLRHDALLQQLANMELMLDKANSLKTCDECVANGESNAFAKQWVSFCERLSSHIRGAYRYCAGHQFHLVSHPVSVLCQSVQKMSQTARRREEELLIRLEDVDAGLQQASLLGDAPRTNGRDAGGAQPAAGTTMMTVLPTDASSTIVVEEEDEKLMKLRADLQRQKELRQSLLLSLEGKRVATSGNTLPSNSAAADISRYGTDLSAFTSKSAPSLPDMNADPIASCVSDSKAIDQISSEADNGDDSAGGIAFVAIGEQEVVVLGPSLHLDGGGASAVVDPEIETLQREVTAAERDVHRLQQGHETLEEEAKRTDAEYENYQKSLEAKLSKARGVVEALMRENSEWKALYQQMSLLDS